MPHAAEDETRTSEGLTCIPNSDLTLDQVRSRLSGLHFSQECLTDGERTILGYAEGLLRLIDARDPNGYAR